MNVQVAEDRVDGKEDDPHAKAEVTPIDVDQELQQEGQPHPAAAIEGEVALQPGLEPGAQGEGGRRKEQQPGNGPLKCRLAGMNQNERAQHAAGRRQGQTQRQKAAHRGQFVAVDPASHHIGGQDRHEIRGIGLDFGHAGSHQQRKCHEARPAGHDIDHPGQKSAGK
jgi:hypothetical protein